MKPFVTALVIALTLGTAYAQDTKNNAPALTDVQKLQLINASKDIELWQLKAQQAASEFEKAKATIQKMVAEMTPAGYQLNEKLDLVKNPEPPK